MRELTLPGRTKPYVMAHRGNRVLCPENTLASFSKAFEEGADILETDLHLSADGVFMCIHDATPLTAPPTTSPQRLLKYPAGLTDLRCLMISMPVRSCM